MNEQLWWFVARSGGIVAWALVTLSVCWGLFISTKAVAKASQPAHLLNLHRFLGGLSVVFTAIHVAGLMLDSYVQFRWMDILVPWAASWKPTAVAWGVIAMYLLVAVEVTSLLMKRLPRTVWRQIHRSSFALYILSTIHGIQAGTDATNPIYRMLMTASINIVAFLTIVAVLAHRKKQLGSAGVAAAS
ncbi:MAG: ferric reductase-like transmembrane domain-containing protein [Acidimicrobiales bacterium]